MSDSQIILFFVRRSGVDLLEERVDGKRGRLSVGKSFGRKDTPTTRRGERAGRPGRNRNACPRKSLNRWGIPESLEKKTLTIASHKKNKNEEG